MAILGEMVKASEPTKGKLTAKEVELVEDVRAFRRMVKKTDSVVDVRSARILYSELRPAKVSRLFGGMEIPSELAGGFLFSQSYGNHGGILDESDMKRLDEIQSRSRDRSYEAEILVHLVTKDCFDRAAEAPRANLDDIRSLATALDLAIFPIDGLEDTRPANDFVNFLHGCADIFVMAPLSMYSIKAHAAADSEPQFFAPRYEQAMMAIAMGMPLWRTMLADMEEIRETLSRHHERLESHDRRIGQVEIQMKQLRDQIVRMEADAARTRARVAQIEAEHVFARDPMSFAVPKGTDIRADGVAIIGPCWGPDFHDAVVKAAGLSANKKQRNIVAKGWEMTR